MSKAPKKAGRSPRKSAMLVIGMHRSGTSMLTNIVHLLGYDLPRTLLGADTSNAAGHWESVAINRLNDEIFASAGTHWRDIRRVDPNWYGSSGYEAMRRKAVDTLADEFGDSTRFVLKDPRLCKLMPFWRTVLDDFGSDIRIASIVRDPEEVAASLHARSALFEPPFGRLLWLRYVLDAERGGRGIDRAHFTYDSLLADWRAAIDRSALGMTPPPNSDPAALAIDSFVSTDHRHHRTASPPAPADAGDWLATLVALGEKWALGGEDRADYPDIDRIGDQFDGALRELGEGLALGLERAIGFNKARAARKELDGKVASLEGAVREAEAHRLEEQSRADDELQTLTTSIERVQNELAAARERAAVLGDDLLRQQDLATSERTRRDDIVATLSHEVGRTRDRIDRDASRLDELHARNAELERLAASYEAQADAARRSLQEEAERHDRATLAASTAQARNAELTERIARLSDGLNTLEIAAARNAVTIAHLEESLAAERAAGLSLQEELRNRRETEAAALAAVSEVRRAREEAIARADDALLTLADTKARWEKAEAGRSVAEAALNDKERDLGLTRHRLEIAEKALAATRHTVDRGNELLADAQQSIRALDTSLASTRALLAERDAQLQSIIASSADTAGRLAAAQASLHDKDLALSAGSIALRHAEALLKTAEAAAAEQEARVAATAAATRTIEISLGSAQRALDAAEISHGFTRQSLREREERLAAIEADLRAADTRHATVEATLREKLTALALAGQRIQAADDEIARREAASQRSMAALAAERDRALAERDAARATFAYRVARALGKVTGFRRESPAAAPVADAVASPAPQLVAELQAVPESQAVAEVQDSEEPWAPIAQSPFFDAAWYCERHPDVAATATDPARHYFEYGAAEGRDPGPDFSTIGYAEEHPELAQSGENPLLHRLRLDAERRAQQIADIRAHPSFDAGWYLREYPDVAQTGSDPAEHYFDHGAREGRDPGPSFRTADYWNAHPAARDAGLNPLLQPAAPTMEAELGQTTDADRLVALVRSSELFDAGWYLATYTDVAADGTDPAWHYVIHGDREQRNPGPLFNTSAYLRDNPDVAAADENALLHYIRAGAAEGRQISAVLTTEQRRLVKRIAKHRYFEPLFYIKRQPAAAAYRQPAEHYLLVGGPKRIDPGPRFKANWYLRVHADLAREGVSPFCHYVEYGEREKRPAAPVKPRLEDLIQPSRRRIARQVLAGEHRLAADPDGGYRQAQLPTASCPIEAAIAPLAHGGETSTAWQLFARLHDLGGKARKSRSAGLPVSDVMDDGLALSDAWFVNERELRLRIEAPLDGDAGSVNDVRAYQARDGILYQCGAWTVSRAAPRFLALRTINPLFPILLVRADAAGVSHYGLLPFPSLFRGGLHQGEASVSLSSADRFADIIACSGRLLGDYLSGSRRPFAVASLRIAATDATGAERIFSRSMREWLRVIIGVELEISDAAPSLRFVESAVASIGVSGDAAAFARKRAENGGALLTLPAAAIPTIGALTSRDDRHVPHRAMIASFIVADAIDNRPRYVATLPAACTAGLEQLQPPGFSAPILSPRIDQPTAKADMQSLPMAICFRSDQASEPALLLRSLASTIPMPQRDGQKHRSLAIAIGFSSIERLRCLLASLTQQTSAYRLRAFVVRSDLVVEQAAEIEAILHTHFAGRGTIAPLMHLAKRRGAIMFVDDRLVLQDPQTVSTLLHLAEAPDIASVGCLQLAVDSDRKAKIKPYSSGLFPMAGADDLVSVADRDCFGVFPAMVYPTAGNSFRLALIGVESWARFGRDIALAPPAEREGRFIAASIMAGLRHIATSGVAATLANGDAAPDLAEVTSLIDVTRGDLASRLPQIAALAA